MREISFDGKHNHSKRIESFSELGKTEGKRKGGSSYLSFEKKKKKKKKEDWPATWLAGLLIAQHVVYD